MSHTWRASGFRPKFLVYFPYFSGAGREPALPRPIYPSRDAYFALQLLARVGAHVACRWRRADG